MQRNLAMQSMLNKLQKESPNSDTTKYPLHAAIARNVSPENFEALLGQLRENPKEHGFDYFSNAIEQPYEQMSPLLFAIQCQNVPDHFAITLIRFGAEIQKTSYMRVDDIFIKVVCANKPEILKVIFEKKPKYIPKSNDCSPLAIAVSSEYEEIVTILLEHGADPNECNMRSPILIRAIETKNEAIIRQLLAKDADPNVCGMGNIRVVYPCSALHNAIGNEMEAMALLLLQHNADITARYNGITTLEHAMKRGLTMVAQAILDQASYPCQLDLQKNPLLEAIAFDRSFESVDSLLQANESFSQMVLRLEAQHDQFFYRNFSALQFAIALRRERWAVYLVSKDVGIHDKFDFAYKKIQLVKYYLNSQQMELVRNFLAKSMVLNDETLYNTMALRDIAFCLTLIEHSQSFKINRDQQTLLSQALAFDLLPVARALLNKYPNPTFHQLENKPLHSAIAYGHDFDTVNDCIEKDTSEGRNTLIPIPTTPQPLQSYFGLSPLQFAIRLRNHPWAVYMIQKGDNLEDKYQNMTPLWHAYLTKQRETVEMLIQNGADVNAEYYGKTLLLHAYLTKQRETFVMLIQNGANINAEYEEKILLWHAYLTEQRETVEILIQNGADVNAEYEGKTLLWHYVVKQDATLIEMLFRHGATTGDANTESDTVMSLLHTAIRTGNTAICLTLIEHGAAIEGVFEGMSTLSHALHLGLYTVAEAIIKACDDPNKLQLDRVYAAIAFNQPLNTIQDIWQNIENNHPSGNLQNLWQSFKPLHFAIALKRLNWIIFFIRMGVNLETHYQDMTALHHVIKTQQTEVLRPLLHADVDIEAPYQGMTPLHHAISKNSNEGDHLALILISKDANIRATTELLLRDVWFENSNRSFDMRISVSTLKHALHFERKAIIERIVQKLRTEEAEAEFITALQDVINENNLSKLKLILNLGIQTVFFDGTVTPYQYALYQNRTEIVKYMRSINADVLAYRAGLGAIHAAFNSHDPIKRIPPLALLKFLLNDGESINSPTTHKNTPLHLLLKNKSQHIRSRPDSFDRKGFEDAFWVLLSAQPDLHLEDRLNKSVYKYIKDSESDIEVYVNYQKTIKSLIRLAMALMSGELTQLVNASTRAEQASEQPQLLEASSSAEQTEQALPALPNEMTEHIIIQTLRDDGRYAFPENQGKQICWLADRFLSARNARNRENRVIEMEDVSADLDVEDTTRALQRMQIS